MSESSRTVCFQWIAFYAVDLKFLRRNQKLLSRIEKTMVEDNHSAGVSHVL